ncbi:MAG TPA: hypothetical protein VLE73_04050 [Candidatus Saccharimonadales bacterium]|nr:hypothetical protein [Candidatus Saccharimonadales bacterium]
MGERATAQTGEVLFMFANMNLPVADIAFGGVTRYRNILEDIEEGRRLYPGGYDTTPTRRLLADMHLFGPRYLGVGVHQTWPVSPLEDMRRRPPLKSAVINMAAYAMMPDTHSAASMDALKGSTLLTVYGDQRNKDGTLRDFRPHGYTTATQVSPELITETGGKDDYHKTHNSLWQRGVRGVIIPSHHLVRAHMNDPDVRLPWRKTLQAVEEAGAQVHGLHVEAGRIDTRHDPDKRRSLGELAAILQGPSAISQTTMGEVLAAAYGIWRRQRDAFFISDARLRQLHDREQDILAIHTGSHHTSMEQVLAQDPEIAQTREENTYARMLHKAFSKVPVSVEIPYKGLLAVRQAKRLTRPDFVSLHRDIAVSLHEFFAGLPD